MGGVDLSDQLCGYYCIASRAQIWSDIYCSSLWMSPLLMLIYCKPFSTNHRNTEQLGFRLDLVQRLFGDFSSRKHTITEAKIQEGHWPVSTSRGRCKCCLKKKDKTFGRMGCEMCGKRICLACFKDHCFDDLA